jgi:hypothetical protein
LANIGGIEDVLQDRCHEIIMPRGLNPKLINTEVRLDDPLWEQTRDRLYQFYLAECSSVAQAYQLVCEAFVHAFEGSDMDDPISIAIRAAGVSSRDLELWKPLFAMGHFLDSEDGWKYRGDLFSEGSIFYQVKEVKEWLASWFDEEQKWLTTRWVGNALRRLGFAEKRRVGTGYEYRLIVHAVQDLGVRLGLVEPRSSEHGESNEDSRTSEGTQPLSSGERSELSEQVNVVKEEEEEQLQSHDPSKDALLTKFTSSLPSPSSPSNEAGGDTQ